MDFYEQYILASAVVPFIMKGEKGEKGDPGDSTVQSITGVIIRTGVYNNNTKYSSGELPSDDGIKYKDVVYYNGDYYVVK